MIAGGLSSKKGARGFCYNYPGRSKGVVPLNHGMTGKGKGKTQNSKAHHAEDKKVGAVKGFMKNETMTNHRKHRDL